MKIAIIGRTIGLSPDSAGGAQTLARNIARLCAMHGVEVDFILWGASSQRSESYQINERRIGVYYFTTVREALLSIVSGYTKIFIFMVPFREMLLLYKISRNKELIYFDLYFSKFYRRVIKKILVKFVFRKVVTFSPRIARSYFLIKNKVIYSLPLISDKVLKTIKNEGWNKKQPKFAYVGGVFVEKGIEKLIRIFKQINMHNEKYYLAIFGYYNSMNIKDAHILQEINNLPFITEKFLNEELSCLKHYENNLSQFYREADVIILPYTRKHIDSVVDVPLVIIEALLSGCIVITPKIKHYREIGVSQEFQYETEEELGDVILSIGGQQIERQRQKNIEKREKYLRTVKQFSRNLLENASK